MRVMVTGGTGFVGARLCTRLRADGIEVRCLVRDPESPGARALAALGCEVVGGDVRREEGLDEALAGCEVAYYLVHMIGEGAAYADTEREAAARFATAAKRCGVARIVYVGGLGADDGSEHLASRHACAVALAEAGPPLTYFRAGMVIGPGSESYELLRGIVERLPAIPAPEWLQTKTQPIGIDDLVEYLRAALDQPESVGETIQVGGPEAVSYQRLVDEMARALGRRPPRRIAMSEEIARPRTIAAGAAAVTPGTPRVAAAISLGIARPTVVTDGKAAELFPQVRPRRLDFVLGKAVDEQREAAR